MVHVRIIVEHVPQLPAGLPAVWTDDTEANGGRTVRLYLRGDLPLAMVDHFRAMAIRDCVPDAQWDDFTVTASAKPAMRALSA